MGEIIMAPAKSEVTEGSGGSPASSKIDEWRRYFRDRGLSAGDIPKALVVHEVLRRPLFELLHRAQPVGPLLARDPAH
jgi:hypothetical protein